MLNSKEFQLNRVSYTAFNTTPVIDARIKMMLIIWLALPGILMAQSNSHILLTENGSNIDIAISSGCPSYFVSRSRSGPQFPSPQTIVSNVSAGTYTYGNALTNGVPLEFFDVNGSCEIDPGASTTYTGGAIPPIVPQIAGTSFSGNLRVGDTLTINGDGFSTICDENVVHFPEAVTVRSQPGCTATSITASIPRQAVSGPTRVQVGHQVSDPSILTIYAADGFTSLTSVSFQKLLGQLWLTDTGSSSVAARVRRLDFAGSAWNNTEYDIQPNFTRRFVGGQGFDAGQYWYYQFSNATTNGGTRRIFTGNPPGPGGAFRQIFTNGDSVDGRGTATSPSFADLGFFAYIDTTASTSRVARVPLSGAINTNYGALSGTISYGTVAGLAFDLSNRLYVAELSQLRRIDSATSSTLLTSSGFFTSANGIALDQVNSTDPGGLLAVDSGSLYYIDLNQASLTKRTILSGITGMRASAYATTPLTAATCTTLPSTELSLAVAAEPTKVRQIPDPRITLSPSEPTRIWISKQFLEDSYPSQNQIADHQIAITAQVTPIPNPARNICFRVVDPPDMAPYSITGWCDNRHTSFGIGTFVENGEAVYCTTTNTGGTATATLNATPRVAGDNYVVQASFDNWAADNTTKALAQTGIITAWKREYLEKDPMFRRGGILYQDFDPILCIPNCNRITLFAGANVLEGDSIIVFDETNTAEGGGEPAVISGLSTIEDGSILVTLDTILINSYFASTQDVTVNPRIPLFDNGHSGGVGVPSAGHFESDLNDIWEPFDDGFVEYWVPPAGTSAMPYVSASLFNASVDHMAAFHQIWFAHRDRVDCVNFVCPGCCNRPHNYFHLMGASDHAFAIGISNSESDFSYVMVQKIEGAVTSYCFLHTCVPPGSDFPLALTQNYIMEVTDHELAHQFDINTGFVMGYCNGDGEDTFNSWCGTGPNGTCLATRNDCAGDQWCLMNNIANPDTQTCKRSDGINRLDCEDLTAATNCVTAPPEDCSSGISVRTHTDPD